MERVGGVVAEVGRGGGRREGRGRGAERRLELERGGEAAQSISSVGMLKKPSTRAVAGRAQRGRCDNCIFFFFFSIFLLTTTWHLLRPKSGRNFSHTSSLHPSRQRSSSFFLFSSPIFLFSSLSNLALWLLVNGLMSSCAFVACRFLNLRFKNASRNISGIATSRIHSQGEHGRYK